MELKNKEKVLQLIKVFTPFISGITHATNNIVIGGTSALFLHGLELSREVDDLDLIIYSPDKDQKRVLEMLAPLALTDYYGDSQRTIKVKGLLDLSLNIIISDEKMPDDLLTLNGLFIQSIKGII